MVVAGTAEDGNKILLTNNKTKIETMCTIKSDVHIVFFMVNPQ